MSANTTASKQPLTSCDSNPISREDEASYFFRRLQKKMIKVVPSAVSPRPLSDIQQAETRRSCSISII
jgi:hypothetical protein